MTRERVRQILNLNNIKPRDYTRPIKRFKPYKPTTRERFWSYVDKSGGEDACWVWTGNTNSESGYGQFSCLKILKKERFAHRISYRLAHGKKPKLWVLHKCDNPPCVNPKHLYEGTPKQNVADRVSRGRSAYQRDFDGWYKKLTEGKKTADPVKVRKVREMYAEGLRKCDIARALELNPNVVSNIITGKSFSYIQ